MEYIKAIIEQIIHILKMHVLFRLEHIQAKDILDILILSVFFFIVFKFIINRRAARLALGMIFFVIIIFLSRWFDMTALSFIFRNFTQAGIIAIIIMFQPEIRSALEKLGNAPMSNIKHITNDTKSLPYITQSIEVLTQTVCDLSMEKTGALIVIERSTKLGEYIKTGTMINAQLSAQLLKNVFYNKAPLHDGAVILRNYRVYAAGCFLPLSRQENIDESFGTRHRAGIGITEESDAIVIIVSEETGRISIAHDGNLKQNYSYKSLKSELEKYLLPAEPVKPINKKSKRGKK